MSFDIERISVWHKKVKEDQDLELGWKLVEEEYSELLYEVEEIMAGKKDKHDRHRAAKESADLIWVAARLIYDLGFDPCVVLNEVAKSNESKFIGDDILLDPNNEVILDTYLEGTDCEATTFDDGDIGCFNHNGKLSKGPFYQPVKYKNFYSDDA